jgi:hypothetical protein
MTTKRKYTTILTVECYDVKIISDSADGFKFVRISYKIKGGRKVYRLWIDPKWIL